MWDGLSLGLNTCRAFTETAAVTAASATAAAAADDDDLASVRGVLPTLQRVMLLTDGIPQPSPTRGFKVSIVCTSSHSYRIAPRHCPLLPQS
jgi:hypothetical protein